MSNKVVSPNVLRDLVHYEPDTGALIWKPRGATQFSGSGRQTAEHNCAIWNGKYAGTPAFNHVRSNGYLGGKLRGRNYKAHRFAWAVFFGEWPTHDIDHINRDRADNRLVNLRAATRSENLRNTGLGHRNRSGVTGVSWARERAQWNAKIGVNGKQVNLGYFDTLEQAVEARRSGEALYWGHPTETYILKKAILAADGVTIEEV